MGKSEILDYEELVARIGGDTDFVRELLIEFCSDLPSLYEELVKECESGNLEGLIRSAHSLKGSSANLSGKRISQFALIMERAGKDGKPEQAIEVLPLMKQAIDEFRLEVEALLQPNQQETS